MNLKDKLDSLVREKNTVIALFKAPDPLQIAKIHNDEFISLVCALFAYGNAQNIVNFLKKLDFSLLNSSEDIITKNTKCLKYRFQNSKDINQIFITLRRIKQENSLEELFTKAYKQDENILSALKAFIIKVRKINSYASLGYDFFFTKPFIKEPSGTIKRYNMFLRWLVRKDELDLGLWRGISTKDLLMPLDTHTHKVALNLGLMQRKSYDFKAVLELTANLRRFDENDPVKYDFALYRLGQSKEYLNL